MSLSTAEAEYYLATAMAIEVTHLHNRLGNTCLTQSGYTAVLEDNTPRIEWSNHAMGGRERADHVDTRKRFAHVLQFRCKMVRAPF